MLVPLANLLSNDMNVLRPSLLPGLLDASSSHIFLDVQVRPTDGAKTTAIRLADHLHGHRQDYLLCHHVVEFESISGKEPDL